MASLETLPMNCVHSSEEMAYSSDYLIGLMLAVSSSIFIGASFIIKKKGLLKVARNSNSRAGKGGYAYLKEWLWWVGLLTMGVGEGANFIAFGFAPAGLVATLGALSVLVGAVLSSYLLKERLNLYGKIGCALCLLGSTIVVINTPAEREIDSLATMQAMLLQPAFIIYTIIVVSLGVYLMIFVAPKQGSRNILIYISICSLLGSLTVLSAKGLSISLRFTFGGKSQLLNPLMWFFLLTLIVNITIQMNYLNRALDTFNTAVVTPIYYVLFTTLCTTSSAILFQIWKTVPIAGLITTIAGFLVIVTGVFLLNAFKDFKMSFAELWQQTELYKKHPLLPHPNGEGIRPSHSPLKNNKITSSDP